MKKQFHLTSTGKAELEQEHKALCDKRAQLAEDIATARSQGDLAENAEYHAAKDDQARNEARIEEIEHILANSDIIKDKKSASKVSLGSVVKLKSDDGQTKQFQVVGTVEANPLEGKISDESPIGQALMGKKEGEQVEIKTPADTCIYKITDIA